jgi:5'-phosphate synthase pdxT subunit
MTEKLIDTIVIGILALQGDFKEHKDILESIGGCSVVEIRLPDQLTTIDGLIIPGGESTTISKLIHNYGFVSKLKDFHKSGSPIWGTCAGMIVIAKEASSLAPWAPLNFLDISITRNGYGRQLDSFQTNIKIDKMKPTEDYPGIFIRAPKISHIGSKIKVLARLNNNPVAVQEGNVLATSFHPELTNDKRFHEMFLTLVTQRSRIENQKSTGLQQE